MPGGQNQTGEANAERLEAPERGHLLRRLLGQALRAACHHSAGCSSRRHEMGRTGRRVAPNVGRIDTGEQLDSDGTLCARRAPYRQGRETSTHAQDLSLSGVARAVPPVAIADDRNTRKHGKGEVPSKTLRDDLDLKVEFAGV